MIPYITVTKRFTFEASHRLYLKDLQWRDGENEKIFGKCSNLHGHSYKLFVTVGGAVQEDGMIINFTKLSEIIHKQIIDVLDHQNLNGIIGDKIPTTCENLLSWVAERLVKDLPNLMKLKLYETENCFATLVVREEDDRD